MRSRLIPIRMQEWNQDCVPLPIATSYYMSTIGQWYPLQEAEGKSLDYSDHTSAYPSRPSGSEDDNIDELWTKFLSTYCPAKKTGAVPAGRCEPDVYLCEPDSEKLVFAADLKCTCDCSSGTSHGHFRSRGAPDSSGAITMSLQEACKVFKRAFIESSKRRQDGITSCRSSKGEMLCVFNLYSNTSNFYLSCTLILWQAILLSAGAQKIRTQ